MEETTKVLGGRVHTIKKRMLTPSTPDYTPEDELNLGAMKRTELHHKGQKFFSKGNNCTENRANGNGLVDKITALKRLGKVQLQWLKIELQVFLNHLNALLCYASSGYDDACEKESRSIHKNRITCNIAHRCQFCGLAAVTTPKFSNGGGSWGLHEILLYPIM